jgi:putative membrane protein
MTGALAVSLLSVLAAGATEKTGVEVPKDEKAYLERLQHGNQTEIQLGELGKKKAASAAVKEFAERMIVDHNAANQKVTTLASTLKLKLGEPNPTAVEKKCKEADKAAQAKLEALEGQAFDQAFMSHMVGAHDATLGKLIEGQKTFASGQVNSLITELLPKVSEHRDHAYKVLGQVKPAAGVGGSGSQQLPNREPLSPSAPSETKTY